MVAWSTWRMLPSVRSCPRSRSAGALGGAPAWSPRSPRRSPQLGHHAHQPSDQRAGECLEGGVSLTRVPGQHQHGHAVLADERERVCPAGGHRDVGRVDEADVGQDARDGLVVLASATVVEMTRSARMSWSSVWRIVSVSLVCTATRNTITAAFAAAAIRYELASAASPGESSPWWSAKRSPEPRTAERDAGTPQPAPARSRRWPAGRWRARPARRPRSTTECRRGDAPTARGRTLPRRRDHPAEAAVREGQRRRREGRRSRREGARRRARRQRHPPEAARTPGSTTWTARERRPSSSVRSRARTA